MEKNRVLHDPHCIPGWLLVHLLWNILMVVALEVKDLFCFFENCIPVPVCTASWALERIRKGGCEKDLKSSVLEVLLKCHWSSTSWLALCQRAPVLEQVELGKEVVSIHIYSPKLYETHAHLSILQLGVLIAAVPLRNLLFTWLAARIHSDAGFVSCSGGVARTPPWLQWEGPQSCLTGIGECSMNRNQWGMPLVQKVPVAVWETKPHFHHRIVAKEEMRKLPAF